MVNPSRQKGTAFETLVVDYLRQHFPYAMRHPLHGTVDLGDVHGVPGLVVQCKNAKRTELSEWIKSAHEQAANAGVSYGIVVHKRRGKAHAEEQFVTLTLDDFVAMYGMLVALEIDATRRNDRGLR